MPTGSYFLDRKRVPKLAVAFNFGDKVTVWHRMPLCRLALTVPSLSNTVRYEHYLWQLVVVFHLATIVPLFVNRVRRWLKFHLSHCVVMVATIATVVETVTVGLAAVL